MRFLLAAIGSVILGAGVASAQDAHSQDPAQILENAARTMLKELDAHRGRLVPDHAGHQRDGLVQGALRRVPQGSV